MTFLETILEKVASYLGWGGQRLGIKPLQQEG